MQMVICGFVLNVHTMGGTSADEADETAVIKDANGQVLADGDSVRSLKI